MHVNDDDQAFNYTALNNKKTRLIAVLTKL